MKKTWQWTLVNKRLEFAVSVANELWYSDLANGERRTNYVGIATYRSKDYPDCVVVSFTALWLVIRFGYSK